VESALLKVSVDTLWHDPKDQTTTSNILSAAGLIMPLIPDGSIPFCAVSLVVGYSDVSIECGSNGMIYLEII
jgi:hypothetical protein